MSTISTRWERDKHPHLSVEAWLKEALARDAVRRQEEEHHLRLYSEREYTLYRNMVGTVTQRSSMPRKRRRLSENVVRNNIDAWVNMVSLNRPHVTYMTKGADWSLQKKARLRTRFVEAHFLKYDLYDKAQKVCKHAGILGYGMVHVLREHSRISYDIVLPGEVIVDPLEASSEDPRYMARQRLGGVDKNVLAELFPEHAKRILDIPGMGTSNRVPFVDAWHLPSGPDADDGFHAQIIPGHITLSKHPYQWDAFPIVKLNFEDSPIGWFGSGIAEEIGGIQLEINSINRTLQENAYMGGNLKCAVKRGSNVQSGALTNALGCPVIEYNDTPPTWFAHDIAPQQLFQRLADLRQRASEIIGISQLNVESQTPFASMSGRARLVHNQSESRRFNNHVRRYEKFFNEVAERTLEAAADLAEDNQDIEVIFPGRTFLETVRYSDVEGELNDFDAQAWTASLAGETPAARLEHIKEMMGLGMIDMAGALELYEVPHDLRSYMEMALAPIELTREAIDRIVEDGVSVFPTPMMDLNMAMKHAQMWFQRGQLRGVEPRRLNLLLDFHKACQMLLARASQAQAPAPGAAPVGAPAALTGQTLQQAPVAIGAV